MKKIIILILMIGCLTFCIEPASDIYTGTLSEVVYGRWAYSVGQSWTLTFEDGQIYTVYNQPIEGFKVGEFYTISGSRDRRMKVRIGR